MTATALAVIGGAVVLDRLVGEPPTALHPVAWFGQLVAIVDRDWGVGAGVAVALLFPLAAAAVVWGVVAMALRVDPWFGAGSAAVALFLTTSLRSLLELTTVVVTESTAAPERARETIRGLVGRDTTVLSGAELRSGAVESAAENLADGLVAPLIPFALLAPVSLPLAAALAAWVKAVNTLDSMLGYPDKPVGTASARLDDIVMWLPARLAAVLIALAALDPRALACSRAWSGVPASPNSGWPMATLACVLDVRLAKEGAYVLNPACELPTAEDGTRAVAVVSRAGLLAVVLAGGVAVWSGWLTGGAVIG